jgi:hypothetical protein
MKKNVKNALALSMILAVTGGTVAFANTDIESKVTAKTEVTSVSEPKIIMAEQKEVQGFIVNEGKIIEISDAGEDGTQVVTISNEQGGLRFSVNAGSVIVDRETGKSISASNLTKGIVVSVIYPELSPMGMSMPPYLGSATVIVANADKGEYMVGLFDENFIDSNNELKLNISDDTVLTNSGVSKIGVSPEMVKGQNALVFYTVTTKSIPAQTTPSFVMVLEKDSEDVKEPTDSNVDEETEETEEGTVEWIPLRDTAEAKGFTVTWQGRDKAILVEKADGCIEITIDEALFAVDGKEREAARAAALVDGVMYVSSEVLS